MIVSTSQIVGLIEIETPSVAGLDCLVTTGREEESLEALLVWLSGPMSRPTVADEPAGVPTTGGPLNRCAGLLAPESAVVLAADLMRLEAELADAAAQFRLRLAAMPLSR